MAPSSSPPRTKAVPPAEADGGGIPPSHAEILREVREQYGGDEGLEEMARVLGERLQPARERVTVMIVGNHSAGKSSLINWYLGENVQAVGSAMETSEITFVTHGRKRERFRGKATLRHLPYLDGIEDAFEGVVDNLSTEVHTSPLRASRVVDFVDTPGLTDGHLQYRFDVNGVIAWLAARVDLVFVFFDPHGQALCARTQEVVRALSKQCHEKCHYFLTKADDIKTEKDRSKTMSQLSQSLSHQVATDEPFYGEHALVVRTIYRPLPGETEMGAYNQLDETAELIEQTVRENTQRHCEALEADAKRLDAALGRALERDRDDRAFNWRARALAWLLLSAAWAVPTMLLFYVLRFVEGALVPGFRDSSSAARHVSDAVRLFASLPSLFDAEDTRYGALGAALGLFAFGLLGAALLRRLRRQVRPDEEVARLRAWSKHVRSLREPRTGLVHELWTRYLADAVDEGSDDGDDDE